MRFPLLAVVAFFTATTLQAQTVALGENGLAAAEARLAALPAKTPDDLFLLGGVRFLRGVEKTLQLRWQHSMVLGGVDMPVLRLPVPANRNAKPFEPGLIAALFATLRQDMAQSRAALDQIPPDAEIGVRVDLRALWFDVNMNGTRDPGEGVLALGANTLMARANKDPNYGAGQSPVRFDSADVAWLSAYTHLLSAVSELVLAYDPTTSIASVMSSDAAMRDLLGDTRPGSINAMQFGGWVDQFAMVYGAVNTQPDPARTRAAHAHLLGMIRDNRIFWTRLEAETDDRDEWIPNARQHAALGYDMPPRTGAAWQTLLAEGEDILNGKLLIPYWRISPAGGVNVKKLFMDPPPVDIVTWVQGAGLLPYLERGPVAQPDNLRAFERLVAGKSGLYALLFN